MLKREDNLMRLPKFFWKIIGTLLVLSYFIPIPLGTIRVAAGLSVLICASPAFAMFLQNRRQKSTRFNKLITGIENKVGERWTKNLMMTRPGNDLQKHFQSQ